jgi:hypothetical protein
VLETVLAVLVVVVLLVVAAVLAVWALAKRARRKVEEGLRQRMHRTDPLADGPGVADPHRLKPGDVVQYDGRDWVVRGTLAYDEDGATWREHLLDGSTADGELRRWLSVEDTERGTELVLWDRVAGSDLTPDRPEVTVAGTTFRRDETGTAGFSATGTTGTAPAGTMHYADYVSGGPVRLGFERWSATGSWEVSTGSVVALESLTILHS